MPQFGDELNDDDDVIEDRELFRQLYANLQHELAEELDRRTISAWDLAHVAYVRDDPLNAIRRMREAVKAAVQARLCRERAAESICELQELVQMLAQEFVAPVQVDSVADTETGAGDHQSQSPTD